MTCEEVNLKVGKHGEQWEHFSLFLIVDRMNQR